MECAQNSSPNSGLNVLVVEDHIDALTVLESVVLSAFKNPTISTAKTYLSGLKLLESIAFDVALIDIGLPDGNGIDLVRHIGTKKLPTITIVTTIFDDENHLFDALRAGASGYLLKGHSPEELQTYLVNAISGKPALSPGVAQSMLSFFRQGQIDQNQFDTVDELTEREIEVLQLIAKGCQAKEVSRLLDISTNTVSHHVKNIYSKLNVHNRAEATMAAVKMKLYTPA